jgi:hypothetical protein
MQNTVEDIKKDIREIRSLMLANAFAIDDLRERLKVIESVTKSPAKPARMESDSKDAASGSPAIRPARKPGP